MRYSTLIFDLDGTLVDSLSDLTAAINAARAACGHPPLTGETVRACVGDGLQVLLARCLPEPDRARAAAPFKEHYAEHLLDATVPYPAIPETLAQLLRAGCRMGVVTNKPRDFTAAILEGLGLADYFGVVLGGDDVPARKPAPEPLHAALRALGAGAGHALMVGDGRNDILAARAAGLPVCGVLYGLSDPVEIRALRPDYLIRSPADLLGIVLARA